MLDGNPNVAHHLIVSLIRTIHLMILKHPQNGMQHASEALLACQCLVWVVLACFKFWLAVESKTRKTSCALKTCSFFCYPFSEFCFLTLAFPSIILFYKFIHTFDTLNIPGIPLAPKILWNFSLVIWFSHELNKQNSWPQWLSITNCSWRIRLYAAHAYECLLYLSANHDVTPQLGCRWSLVLHSYVTLLNDARW